MKDRKCFAFECPHPMRAIRQGEVVLTGAAYRTDDSDQIERFIVEVDESHNPDLREETIEGCRLVVVGYLENEERVKALFYIIKFLNRDEIYIPNVGLTDLKDCDLSEVVLEDRDAERWELDLLKEQGVIQAEIDRVEKQQPWLISDAESDEASSNQIAELPISSNGTSKSLVASH